MTNLEDLILLYNRKLAKEFSKKEIMNVGQKDPVHEALLVAYREILEHLDTLSEVYK